MSSQASDTVDFGTRLALVVADLGDDISVSATGKSIRQLKRYAAGAEPPFGVLRSLVEASGATLDWITFGRAISSKDHELSIRMHELEIKALRKALKKTTEINDAEHIKELISLNRKLASLAEEILQIEKRSAPRVRFRSKFGIVAPDILVRLATEAVIRTYKEENVRLPSNALPTEIARFFDTLSAETIDSRGEQDAREHARVLTEKLRSEIRGAADEPGSGKRSAS